VVAMTNATPQRHSARQVSRLPLARSSSSAALTTASSRDSVGDGRSQLLLDQGKGDGLGDGSGLGLGGGLGSGDGLTHHCGWFGFSSQHGFGTAPTPLPSATINAASTARTTRTRFIHLPSLQLLRVPSSPSLSVRPHDPTLLRALSNEPDLSAACGGLAQTPIEHDLIDKNRLMAAPAILGRHRSFRRKEEARRAGSSTDRRSPGQHRRLCCRGRAHLRRDGA
jgi:hypothetical protein